MYPKHSGVMNQTYIALPQEVKLGGSLTTMRAQAEAGRLRAGVKWPSKKLLYYCSHLTLSISIGAGKRYGKSKQII